MVIRIFILVFVTGFLSACHQSLLTNQPKMQELQAIPFNDQTLAQFSWQLIEATDVNGKRIDALFLASESDQPITLKFAGKRRLYIGNLFCNINSIGIHFEDNRLYSKNPIIATMMGCPDDISLRESTMIHDILATKPALYLQSSKGQIQLIIETPKKDKLIFNGSSDQ